MQPNLNQNWARDIGVGRLPCTKWTHTHTLLRGCFQWPPSQIAVPSSSDQNLNAPWQCLGLLLASHQDIRRIGKETKHKSQATFLPSLAQRQLVRIQGKPWPANLGFLLRAPARRCNLRPWPGLWLWWSNSLQYVLCCTCTVYTCLYAVYI